MEDRRGLRSQLAQWLHSFYLTYENPFAYSLELVKNLAGSQATNKEFKRMLTASIAELKPLGWVMTISDDKLFVKTPITPKSMKTPKAKN